MTTPRKPPIKCIPCRVTYEGQRYRIYKDGTVREIFMSQNGSTELGYGLPQSEISAKLIRREASRQRRNRNARERHQAMRDLGMTKTSYGWE